MLITYNSWLFFFSFSPHNYPLSASASKKTIVAAVSKKQQRNNTTTLLVYPLLTTSTLYWTPLPHTPHGHLAAFYIDFWCPALIITLVLFTFTLMPLFSTLSFHSLSLLIRSSSVSANTAKSSAYNSSYGKAALNSLDMASVSKKGDK